MQRPPRVPVTAFAHPGATIHKPHYAPHKPLDPVPWSHLMALCFSVGASTGLGWVVPLDSKCRVRTAAPPPVDMTFRNLHSCRANPLRCAFFVLTVERACPASRYRATTRSSAPRTEVCPDCTAFGLARGQAHGSQTKSSCLRGAVARPCGAVLGFSHPCKREGRAVCAKRSSDPLGRCWPLDGALAKRLFLIGPGGLLFVAWDWANRRTSIDQEKDERS